MDPLVTKLKQIHVVLHDDTVTEQHILLMQPVFASDFCIKNIQSALRIARAHVGKAPGGICGTTRNGITDPFLVN